MSARACAVLTGLLLLGPAWGQDTKGIETSYHAQLGAGTGLGMLEKWCALPNYSFEEQGGAEGWAQQTCNQCHVGADWNPMKPVAACGLCHASDSGRIGARPTIAACMTCHKKDTEKRGDLFTAATDVHVALGMICQDCHVRMIDADFVSDHQFAKGRALDTTEPTMKGTLSCASCHPEQPHANLGERGARLDGHCDKVACETCHTGPRPGWALASRQWNVFTAAGTPATVTRDPGFLPAYKWYDNMGAGAAGDYRLPILGTTERRNAPGAKIYPFNPVTVTWFVKTEESPLDDAIIVPEVKAADTDGDRTVTVDEMRAVYPGATLVSRDMTFSLSHSVRPASQSYVCRDCHRKVGGILDWRALGYEQDPRLK